MADAFWTSRHLANAVYINILCKELTYAERGEAGAPPAGAHTPMFPGRVCGTGASEVM